MLRMTVTRLMPCAVPSASVAFPSGSSAAASALAFLRLLLAFFVLARLSASAHVECLRTLNQQTAWSLALQSTDWYSGWTLVGMRSC